MPILHYYNKCSHYFIFCRDYQTLLTSADSSGSLLRYDPSTNQTTVLLSNLAMPSGVAVSKDGSFVLVSEFLSNRIQRVWLKGPRANSSELFMLLTGRPNNIKRNSGGQFWISVHSVLGLGLPISPRRTALPCGVRVSENRLILQIASLAAEYGTETLCWLSACFLCYHFYQLEYFMYCYERK